MLRYDSFFRRAATATPTPTPTPFDYFRALVQRISSSSTSDPTQYNSEAYDIGGWHDNSVNPSRLTVPSGVTLARACACQFTGGTSASSLLKNAANFLGAWFNNTSITAGDDRVSATSAIFPVAPGDYLQTAQLSSNVAADSWAAVEAIHPDTRYCLAQKSGDQALSAATPTVVTFDGTDAVDTDAFHDPASSPSRQTVPSGVSLVVLSASLRDNNAASGSSANELLCEILKGGSTAVYGLPSKDQTRIGGVNNSISVISGIMAVAPGDYFEVQATSTQGASIIASDNTWFQIEVLDPATKYCLVGKSATQTINNSYPVLTWDVEVADAEGMHDGANPTRLTVPSGCTEARLSFGIDVASHGGQLIAGVSKNGGDISSKVNLGLPVQEGETPSGNDHLNGRGAWVAVTPGDYFELHCYSGNSGTLDVNHRNWFCMECR